MVLLFRLNNIFSFRDEITLDLQAAKIQTEKGKALSGNLFSVAGGHAMKSVSIFGANASGKSNIIKGIHACVDMIRSSHTYNEDTVFDVAPFKFNGNDKKPSSFFIRFVIDEIEYEYSFTMTRTEILTEELFYYPNGRRALVFSRDESKGPDKKNVYEFKQVIKRPMDVASNTSRKTLFISRASQMDREIAKRIFRFFSEDVVLDYKESAMPIDSFIKTRKEQILEILNTADSDIVDIQIQGNALKTFHRGNPDIAFDFDTEESEGTKTLFQMMLSMIDIIRNGRTLLIDEIDTSLHPHLVEYIINLFNNSDHAQLIYTTHNTHLLNTDFQRRDQVYFVNKREDGCSDLYSLFDFKDFRDTFDMEKAYLQGRFDAVPYLSRPNL
ncbi:AAA family ATPase [Prevotella sp. AGR2160]|uniref:AAA family ATPase n=1 Tax=Prevotella sp. AGR2160 TaxID=1280674 RepID=UPI0004120812|nr:ATP-binding protein [Prevotella sp. AGR2160]